MPVPFACPHCGEQTLVDEQYAGHSGPCIACGKTIVVPHFGGSLAAAVARPYGVARSKYLVIGLCITAAIAGTVTIAALVMGPLLGAARVSSSRRACAANLRQIYTALAKYEAAHGTLPPAAVTDAQGQPLYSWRVLILPYLGPAEQRLYSQFQLDQAWDSPVNSRLRLQRPAVFHSPADTTASADETSYVVIAGRSTPFPSRQPMSMGQIIDGRHATILVVEAAATGIVWSEPKDLRDNQLTFQIGVDLGGNHPGGVNALFADGQVRFLPDSMATEEISDLITASGQEPARN